MESPVSFHETIFAKSQDNLWATIPSIIMDDATMDFIADPEAAEMGARIARAWKHCVPKGDQGALDRGESTTSKLEVIGYWIACVFDDEGEAIPFPPHGIDDVLKPEETEGIPPMPIAWIRIHADIYDPPEIQAVNGQWFPIFFGLDKATAGFIAYETQCQQISQIAPETLRFLALHSGGDIPIDSWQPFWTIADENDAIIGIRLTDENSEVRFDLYAPFHASVAEGFEFYQIDDGNAVMDYFERLDKLEIGNSDTPDEGEGAEAEELTEAPALTLDQQRRALIEFASLLKKKPGQIRPFLKDALQNREDLNSLSTKDKKRFVERFKKATSFGPVWNESRKLHNSRRI